jgi:hypothetical protein
LTASRENLERPHWADDLDEKIFSWSSTGEQSGIISACILEDKILACLVDTVVLENTNIDNAVLTTENGRMYVFYETKMHYQAIH